MIQYYNRIFSRKIKIAGILLILFTIWISGKSNGDSFIFEAITIKDGLSQNSGNALCQDSRGFLWIGTNDGLNRYDGYEFKIFNPIPGDPTSLSNNLINVIYEDGHGNLWIGSEGGLNRYNRQMENFDSFKHHPTNTKSLSHNYVRSISEDRRGNLWVGTDRGLNRLDRESGQWTRFLEKPIEKNRYYVIHDIIEDPEGYLWLGTNHGLLQFFPADGRTIAFLHDAGNPGSLSHNDVKTVIIDQLGDLWAGTFGGGLNQFNRETREFKKFTHDPRNPNTLTDNRISDLCRDNGNYLWVGTDSGLNRINLKTGDIQQFKTIYGKSSTLTNNQVYCLLKDNSGVLWIGTFTGGINKIDLYRKNFHHYKHLPNNQNSLSDSLIWTIFEDKRGNIWFGTNSGGLNSYNRETKSYKHFRADGPRNRTVNDNNIRAILEDKKGIFWIGTVNGGLNRYDPKTGRFSYFTHDPDDKNTLGHNKVRNMMEDSSGNFWLGTDGGGLNLFDKKTSRVTRYQHDPKNPNSLTHNRVWAIVEDIKEKNILWVGTYGGGFSKFDTRKQTFKHYRSNPRLENSLSYDTVMYIHQSPNGILWIGTDGGGLNRFNPDTGNFSHIKKEDGLPNNTIYGILEDNQGKLWISHNQGLTLYNPDAGTFRNYNEDDGLQSNEFNGNSCFKSQSGEMFFGGINGANSFFPETIIDNPHIPPVAITRFQLFNKPVPIGPRENGKTILQQSISEAKEIVLSHTDKVLSFEFAALHFASPANNKYAYMMVNLDEEWNEVQNRRFASYTTLPPGEYIFKVKASNNDQIWNEEGISLKITVTPPFWQTWWFLTIVVLFSLLFLFTFYRVRVRSLQKRKVELENLVSQRTVELREANHELEKLSIVARETENSVMIMDPDSSIEWVNEGYTRIYHCTLEQLHSEKGRTLIEVSSNPDIKNIMNEFWETKKSLTYENESYTRKGEKLWTQTTLTPILNDQDRLIKIIGVESDITELKKANELANREKESADRANQAKSEFLARMSHEIRTPMNGVIGFTDMLLDTPLSDEQIDYAKTIKKSGETLITLLNDILDFSKIEAGELSFDPTDFDPEITIYDICEIVSPRIGTKPVELYCRLNDDVPAYIHSDPGRFRQVVVNLMGNAVKFTSKGEIELSLEMDEETSDKIKLHVRVRDTGIGIPEEKLENVFEVFQQADGSTTRKYGGTGLGLSICRQIAEMMGGNVWVESKMGVGSTFHFTCWVEKSKKKTPKESTHKQLAGKRALIIDDNTTNLEILSNTLTKAGMAVQKISDAREVMPLLTTHQNDNTQFDICILDIQMPRISGYELAEQIRKMPPPARKIPLLAFSSSTLSRSRKFREAGFNGFLPKPIHRTKLLKMVEHLLALDVEKETVPSKNEDMVTQHTIVEEAKHSVRILLVEDNPINMKLARFMLEKAGYQLTLANNGREAVDLFTASPEDFDMILMDIQMPELDGREATQEIRKRGFADIPIIAMTAEAMKGDREKCLEAGMDDYIPKPIRRDIIFHMVKKYHLEKPEE